MSFRFQRIILFCADVKRLVTFYQSHFGFSVIGDFNEEWTVLDAGGFEIAFHRIGPAYADADTGHWQAESNAKLVFEVSQDLHVTRKNLVEQGVNIGEVIRYPGVAYLICDGRDPEGNVFQLLQLTG